MLWSLEHELYSEQDKSTKRQLEKGIANELHVFISQRDYVRENAKTHNERKKTPCELEKILETHVCESCV